MIVDGKQLITHEEVDQFYQLASESKQIINTAAEGAKVLYQSLVDDVEFWGVSSSYTGGQ